MYYYHVVFSNEGRHVTLIFDNKFDFVRAHGADGAISRHGQTVNLVGKTIIFGDLSFATKAAWVLPNGLCYLNEKSLYFYDMRQHLIFKICERIPRDIRYMVSANSTQFCAAYKGGYYGNDTTMTTDEIVGDYLRLKITPQGLTLSHYLGIEVAGLFPELHLTDCRVELYKYFIVLHGLVLYDNTSAKCKYKEHKHNGVMVLIPILDIIHAIPRMEFHHAMMLGRDSTNKVLRAILGVDRSDQLSTSDKEIYESHIIQILKVIKEKGKFEGVEYWVILNIHEKSDIVQELINATHPFVRP